MIKVESGCVGCPPEMGCLYEGCPYYAELHFYCDNCGAEEDIYDFYGEQLCTDCIESSLPSHYDEELDIELYEYEGEWLDLNEILALLPKITEKDFKDYGF